MSICILRRVCVCVCAQSFSQVQLFVIQWTIACQAPMSMGFSRQECWSGLPFPPPGDLPAPGIEPTSPALQEDSLPSEPPGKPNNWVVSNSLGCAFQYLSQPNPFLLRASESHLCGWNP